MQPRRQLVFLLLVIAQAAHSVEEYVSRIYEVFPPARFVDHLISSSNVRGFVIFQTFAVLFAVWCWAFPLRLGWQSGRGFVWFWIVVELANGAGHLIATLIEGRYTPGVATAPLLLVLAVWLAVLDHEWVIRKRAARRSSDPS